VQNNHRFDLGDKRVYSMLRPEGNTASSTITKGDKREKKEGKRGKQEEPEGEVEDGVSHLIHVDVTPPGLVRRTERAGVRAHGKGVK
jgi:hypothetical protein